MDILLPLKEANLLRQRIRAVLALGDFFLKGKKGETIHDLRVASRRLRELIDYLSPVLPQEWLKPSRRLAGKITKTLGAAREHEVNLRILSDWHHEKKSNAAALELMIQGQRRILAENRKAARRRIGRNKFARIEKLLSKIRGSRKIRQAPSTTVAGRLEDFVSSQTLDFLNDEALHELRIRSKKMRYTLEIYNALHARSDLAFPIQAIKGLQEVLGEIHDFSVLETGVQQEKEQWNPENFNIIPAALEDLQNEIRREKNRLYGSIVPFYARALEGLRTHFRAIRMPASKLQSG